MGIGIFVLVFVLMMSGIMSNIFGEFMDEEQFSEISSNFPMMVMVWDKMPVLVLFIAIMLMVVMYGFSRNERGMT